MKSLKKNWKTTLIGITAIVALGANVVLLKMAVITATDFAVITTSELGILTFLQGIFSKDGDKTGV